MADGISVMKAAVLQQFCARDPFRSWMAAPFSRGAYTWATDGKIMVRTPRLADVPEHLDAPAAETVWREAPSTQWRQPLLRKLPDLKMVGCDVCDGRGTKHECPGCECKCSECNGAGELEELQAVTIGLRAISLRAARLIIGLEWAEFIEPATEDFLLHFRSDDIEGIVTMLKVGHALDMVATI